MKWLLLLLLLLLLWCGPRLSKDPRTPRPQNCGCPAPRLDYFLEFTATSRQSLFAEAEHSLT